jgi:hypothetical protein
MAYAFAKLRTVQAFCAVHLVTHDNCSVPTTDLSSQLDAEQITQGEGTAVQAAGAVACSMKRVRCDLGSLYFE